jgi:hypothetical protein
VLPSCFPLLLICCQDCCFRGRRLIATLLVGRQEAAIHPHDTLVALAEVAAAFAGFGGIVAALGRRSPRDWSATARFRFANLLSLTVATSILAFLPVAVAHFPIPSSTAWTSSGFVLALFCVSFLTDLVRRVRAIDAPQAGELPRWMAIVWFGGMGGVAIAQLTAIVGFSQSLGAAYVAGILVLLTVSGLQFGLLAFSSIMDGR